MNNLWRKKEALSLEGRKILLALEPAALNELILPDLKDARLEVHIAGSLEDAIQRLTFSPPDFLVLCEGFSTHQPHLNPLLTFVAKMPTSTRTNLIVVWISNAVKTRDYLAAFTLSVNLVMQPEYLRDLTRLLLENWQEARDLVEVYSSSPPGRTFAEVIKNRRDSRGPDSRIQGAAARSDRGLPSNP